MVRLSLEFPFATSGKSPRPSDQATVNVHAENGVVYLRGEVPRPELIEELVERARKVQGVQVVESLLHLPGMPA